MKWSDGLAEWQEGSMMLLSVAFTWRLETAYTRARFYVAEGFKVRVGGPALFPRTALRDRLAEIAEVGGEYCDAVAKHNPLATIASRGCPVGCWFCIVPKMEGKNFTLLPEFPIRPVLCDNNLSGLPADYQEHIIRRYQDSGVKLLDANSGFEPITFTPDVYERWKPLVNEGRGPWRFAYDERKEREQVLRVMKMLADEPQKRKRVYVLIGNEPFDDCMARIKEVLLHKCEPHCQPLLKLNCTETNRNGRPRPWVRFDWTEQRLRDVARWANKWLWKQCTFAEYDNRYRSHRSVRQRAEAATKSHQRELSI